jgi:hypothetical protein
MSVKSREIVAESWLVIKSRAAIAEVREQFGNEEEGKSPPLAAVTRGPI